MSVRGLFVLALAMLTPCLAGAKDAPPALAKLSALIECRADVPDYGDVAFKVVEPDGAKQFGWTEVKQPNPFLREYQLPRPITVFGHKTRRIAFGSAGILAVLDGVDPKVLAAKLNLKDAGFAGKVLLARTIKEQTDQGVTTTIRLNVSTVDSHPGKTLVGCEYQVDVR